MPRVSNRLAALFAIASLSLLALVSEARGAAGVPDPSFGSGGFTVLDEPALINEQLRDVVILPDGKILAAGRRGNANGFLLARFNANGAPDTGFGGTGFKVEPYNEVDGDPRSISDIELRSDGKILAAGLARGTGGFNAFGFGRYLADGSLDPEFGTGGRTTVGISPSGTALALALAPDQKVVAAGENGAGNEAVVVRLTESGQPDATFNAAPEGVRTVDVPASSSEEAHAVRVLADGTVLIGGFSAQGAFLAELDSSGNPVAGFGTAGIAVHDLGTDVVPSGGIEDVAVLADGRVLAAGRASAGGNSQLIVARFTPTGDLDPSFGEGGVFRRNPTGGEDEASALEVMPDGRIVAAGGLGETGPNTGDTWLLRLTPDGQLDPSFGSGGETVASAGSSTDRAFGLALQPDGRAVIAGGVVEGGSKLLAGRFTADEPPLSVAPPVPARIRRRTFLCFSFKRAATIVGTPRRDRLIGTRRADVIVGFGGNDLILARAGNDVVCAGAGRDVVKAGKGADRVDGLSGPDVILGGPGRDLLIGGPGNDRLFGGPGRNDRLGGRTGNDLLVGGRGRRDRCDGGRGGRDRAPRGCERLLRVP